jgi:hypothetical protein
MLPFRLGASNSINPVRGLDVVLLVASDGPVSSERLPNFDRASKELKHSPIDDQQGAADHNGANDLAERNRLSQHQNSEQNCRHGNKKRNQHDVGRTGTPQNPEEYDIGERGR